MKKLRIRDYCSICSVLLLIGTGHTYAAMYKWVDEEGNTHYSQTPPDAGVAAETIKPAPDINREQAEDDLKKYHEVFEPPKEETSPADAAEQANREKEMAARKTNCELGRDKLSRLQDNPRVYSVGEDGERVRLGEDERQARIKEAQTMISDNCN